MTDAAKASQACREAPLDLGPMLFKRNDLFDVLEPGQFASRFAAPPAAGFAEIATAQPNIVVWMSRFALLELTGKGRNGPFDVG